MRDEAQNPLKSAVIASCRHLLAPIVRMLLRGGVTWAEFAELGKEVYVDIARRDYGIQGRPTNSARVAMLTGLSRREVGRIKEVIAGDAPREPARLDRLSQVLTGWHGDPEFTTSAGAPALLSRDGETGSLAALLRRYAGDMPHGAVVKEMERRGLIRAEGSKVRVLARSYVRGSADPDRIRQAGITLHDHAETVAFNVDADRTEPARFERMATVRALPQRHLAAFREFVAERGQALLEDVDAWLSARCPSQSSGKASTSETTHRCGVGVFHIQNEARGSGRE